MGGVSLDKEEWHPPPSPLTPDLIQRGHSPVFHVKNEKASDPFGSEFEHWSALPALSYFVLNAATFREGMRRVAGPTKFKPPPRVTLSQLRKKSWLDDLKDRRISLRKLSRSVPHGFSGFTLLQMLVENNIPINRGVWFARIIGTNEVRALKRKAGLSDTERNESIETAWLSEWTDAVTQLIVYTIGQFDQCVFEDTDVETNDQTLNMEVDEGLFSDTTNVELGTQSEGPVQSQNFSNNEPHDAAGTTNVPIADGVAPLDNRTISSTSDPNNYSSSTNNFASPSSQPEVPQVKQPKFTLEGWQERIQYTTRLVLVLYSEVMLDRQRLLDWLLDKLKSADIIHLPCFVHFAQLLWDPLASEYMAPRLLRSLAARLIDNTGCKIVEPLLFKLMSTNENVFVAPRTWPLIEPHVQTHPAYHRLAGRNQAFMPQDPHDPSDWSHLLEICQLLDKFSRPYRLDELILQISHLNIDTHVLIRTLMTRTMRIGTAASVILCICLLKRLSQKSRVAIADACVEVVLGFTRVCDHTYLTILICELIRARMFNLNMYISRLISRDLLFSSTTKAENLNILHDMNGEVLLNDRQLHLLVLQNLPFDWLTANLRSQIHMMLKKSGESATPTDLDALVEQAKLMLEGKSNSIDISSLCLNDRYNFADRLVHLFELMISSDTDESVKYFEIPSVFVRLCELIEMASPGNVRSLARLFALSISSEKSGPVIVSCVLRQVHVRLMAFVCSGLIDSVVERLIAKLDRFLVENHELDADYINKPASFSNGFNASKFSGYSDSMFHWISWDDIVALRSVIKSPSIMFDLNRLIPLRPAMSLVVSAGHTPVEHDSVLTALHKPGSPDIGQLLTMQGEVGLAQEIANYAQTPGADKAALLQLVAHNAVSIDDLMKSSPKNVFELLRFLILAPGNELGFCFEEVEALQVHRQQFLEHLEQEKLSKLCSSVSPRQFVSRMAHIFPEVYMERIIMPSKYPPDFMACHYKSSDYVSFESMLLMCTPFNLQFYRGITFLKFREAEPDKAAKEILEAAYAHPEASPALQGLLQNVDSSIKNLIFTKTVERFLNEDLGSTSWSHLGVHSTLIGVLARSVVEPLAWSLDQVPRFLDRLVHAAKKDENAVHLRKVLTIVLRISVIGRLHNINLPSAAVPYLETLLHVQAFADNYRICTIIEDALRLLLRISAPVENRLYAGQHNLSAQPGFSDGLLLYSKSTDKYSPLPIWSFDLIEDSSLLEGNDGPVDLSLFETYKD